MKDTKVIMYYDHTCVICRTEAEHMQDKHSDKISIIAVDDGLAELEGFGISRIDAMTYLCVVDTDGVMHTGMDAVKKLHQTADTRLLGMPLSRLLSLPIIQQTANFIYPIFARNRYYIPNWITRLLFRKVAEPDDCESGVCQIPPNKR